MTAIIVMLCASQITKATNYTVTNTNDGDTDSLRAAISAANSTPDNDTISFEISTNDTGCTNGVLHNSFNKRRTIYHQLWHIKHLEFNRREQIAD